MTEKITIKEIIVYSILALLTFSVLLGLALFRKTNGLVESNIESVASIPISTKVTVEVFSPIENIESIAEEVAGRYSYREFGMYWDCTKYSMDLVYALRENNYTAKRVAGLYYCGDDSHGQWHEWVRVFLNDEVIDIAATGGYIIPEDVYENCYSFHHYHPVP